MKGIPMDIKRVVDYIKANGPITAQQAMFGCGYTSGKEMGRKLAAYATTHGEIELVNKKWQRVEHRGSNQYIPPNIPLQGYNLWAGAMRPGALDYRNIPSRVV